MEKSKNVNLDFENFEDKTFEYNLKHQVVSVLAKDNAKKAKDMLNKLNKSELLLKLQNNGLDYLTTEQLDQLLKFISARLVEISFKCKRDFSI